MKAFRRGLIVCGLIAALSVVALPSQSASAASSGEFVSRINSLRASKGLAPLSVSGNLTSVAQSWANHMAAANAISHNPSYSSQISGNWTKVGENVGTGPDVSSIFNALVASSGHYKNMVEPSFTSIGVGIATGSDGRLYTVHNFAAFPGAGSSTPTTTKTTAAPKAPTPTTAKKTVTTAAPKSTSTSAPSANSTTTTAAPAPAPAPAPEPAPQQAAAAPAAPEPSQRILTGLSEVGSITTQG